MRHSLRIEKRQKKVPEWDRTERIKGVVRRRDQGWRVRGTRSATVSSSGGLVSTFPKRNVGNPEATII
jgi:hypothetical protein